MSNNIQKLLYIIHIDWNWIKQRPQFLAESMEEYYDINIVYIKPLRDLFKPNNTPSNCYGIFQIPFGRIKIIKQLNDFVFRTIVNKFIAKTDIIWFTNPAQYIKVSSIINTQIKVVYDCMDDLSEFPHNKNNINLSKIVRFNEQALINRSDFLFFSSNHLKNTLKKRYGFTKKASILNNGIDHSILDKFIKKDVKGTTEHFYDIYYVGTISEWFDFKSLISILEKFPVIRFVLIGPSDVTIPVHERLLVKGSVEHSKLPDYLVKSSALIMPFKINDLILSVNPVKLYEYIAVGRPVITCQYEEINKFHDFVYPYESIYNLENIINDLINGELKVKSLESRIEFLIKNTWDARAKFISNEIV